LYFVVRFYNFLGNVSSVLPDCITVKEEPATAADVEENISEPRQSTPNLQTQDSDSVEISELSVFS